MIEHGQTSFPEQMAELIRKNVGERVRVLQIIVGTLSRTIGINIAIRIHGVRRAGPARGGQAFVLQSLQGGCYRLR